MVEFTDWARDILKRSHQAAARFNPNAKIRLANTSSGVQALLVDAPADGDRAIELDGLIVYVEEGLEGLVDIEEPHDRVVLRPVGSAPNVRGTH